MNNINTAFLHSYYAFSHDDYHYYLQSIISANNEEIVH